MTLSKKPLEEFNIVGKGENTGKQNFLLFHYVSNPIKHYIIILALSFRWLQMLSICTSLEYSCLVKDLKLRLCGIECILVK